MAAETFTMRLLGAMDTLWFHQIILFSEQSLLHESPEITKTPLPTSESAADFSSRNSSQISETSDQEISSLASMITNSQDESNSSQEITDHDEEETTTDIKDRPKRLNLISSTKTRFQSYSPLSSQKRSRRLRYSRKLEKSMSCKSLGELEIEEVKGFMDLGFVFKKENLSKNMISLIPGLQRIESRELITNNSENVEEEEEDDDDNDYEENKRVMRPYLSEAWIIKRPGSPLLNLRIPRVSTAEDMKKHLKNWARTVASAVQLES